MPSRSLPFVRMATYTLCAVVLLTTSALLAAGVVAFWREVDWLTLDTLSRGLVCALIGWLFVAALYLGRDSRTLPVAEPRDFLRQTRRLLEEMGYEVASPTHDALSARPTFAALLFGGGVHVVLQAGEAKITGPRLSVERIRHHLRVGHHLHTVHESLHKTRSLAERMVKRVEISVRVTPEQLGAVQAELIEPLAREAEVCCELNVMVQNANGIRAGFIDAQVRGWLESRGIAFDLHRDFVEMDEPLVGRRREQDIPA